MIFRWFFFDLLIFLIFWSTDPLEHPPSTRTLDPENQENQEIKEKPMKNQEKPPRDQENQEAMPGAGTRDPANDKG